MALHCTLDGEKIIIQPSSGEIAVYTVVRGIKLFSIPLQYNAFGVSHDGISLWAVDGRENPSVALAFFHLETLGHVDGSKSL